MMVAINEEQWHRKPPWRIQQWWSLALVVSAGLASLVVVWGAWQRAQTELNKISYSLSAPASGAPSRSKPPRQVVKGVYLTAVSANDPKKLDKIICENNAYHREGEQT